MKFYVEIFGQNGNPCVMEEVNADYYRKADGFVTFYENVVEPSQTESGLILSVGDKTIERIVVDYNERVIRFISESQEEDNEGDYNF